MNMNLRRTATSLVLLTSIALAACVPIASAGSEGRSFERTFPHATKICARADAGTLGDKLKASTDKVKAACATVHASFDAAATAFLTSTSGLKAQAQAAVTATQTACTEPAATDATNPTGPGTAACKAAREQQHATLRGLHDQLKAARKAYGDSIKSARHTFWKTIHALKGGSSVSPDSATTAPVAPTGPAL